MSALADALVAAQRRALAGVEKQYVAGKLDRDGAGTCLNLIGLNDEVDQDRLFFALDMIRDFGASLPSEPTASPQKPDDEPMMTVAQGTFIDKLWSDQSKTGMDKPDVEGLSKAKASELISQLKNGSYNPADWSIPF